MERNYLLTQRPKKEKQSDMAFIAGPIYCKSVERIVRKYWPILLKDPTLKLSQEKPLFKHRKAPGIRNKIAKNVLKPP